MIKEILCDRTMAGSPLQGIGGLKFIAACNPYRKYVLFISFVSLKAENHKYLFV